MAEIRVLEYLDLQSRSPFAAWFEGLNAVASAKVAAGVYQLAAGNWSNVKGVGAGVFERKIDAGPGYRIYFGKHGDRLDPAVWQHKTTPAAGYRDGKRALGRISPPNHHQEDVAQNGATYGTHKGI